MREEVQHRSKRQTKPCIWQELVLDSFYGIDLINLIQSQKAFDELYFRDILLVNGGIRNG